jgi:uncharacterized membrane protein YdbT with pleckstrin-like domain
MVFSKTRSSSVETPATPGGAAPAEQVIARLRPHARILVAPCIILIVTAGMLGYFGGNLPEAWQNSAIVAGAALVAALLWLMPVVTWLSQRYVITTRRIIITRGLFVRRRTELLHSRSHDITLRRTVFQSIFRSGNLLINSGIGEPVVLRDVPGAHLVQSALHDLVDERDLSASQGPSFQPALPNDSVAWGPS